MEVDIVGDQKDHTVAKETITLKTHCIFHI